MQTAISCVTPGLVSGVGVPRLVAFVAALLLTLAWHAQGSAAELSSPAGRVILTVTGNVAVRNTDGGAVFDRVMLSALPQITVRTETPWTDGVTEFTGPRVREVLALVGANGSVVRAAAINDYEVEIPMTDFEDHDVILAMQRDGETMRVRDRGPLWVIYPWTDVPSLRTEIHHGRSIWQLKTLVVE